MRAVEQRLGALEEQSAAILAQTAEIARQLQQAQQQAGMPGAAQGKMVQIKIPDNWTEGKNLVVNLGGQQLRLTPPPGSKPGQVLVACLAECARGVTGPKHATTRTARSLGDALLGDQGRRAIEARIPDCGCSLADA